MRVAPFSFLQTFGGGPPPEWPETASVPLHAWYRADRGVTEASSLVSGWADQSGAGDANRHQTASGADRPGYVASDAAYGHNAVLTADATQFMNAAGVFSAAIVAPVSVVIVGEVTNNLGTLLYGGAAADSFYLFVTNLYVLPNNVGPAADATIPCAILYTDDGTGGGSAAKLYIGDTSTPIATAVTNWTSTSTLGVFKSASGLANAAGKLAEVIVFDGVLNGTDISNLVTYLNVTRAYGLSVT